MNTIDVRTANTNLDVMLSREGMRFEIRTDGHNAMYVQPMPSTFEHDYGDDAQYVRMNFPYTFKMKVSEKRNGAITYTPVLSANFKRHYGTVLTEVVRHTLTRMYMRQ